MGHGPPRTNRADNDSPIQSINNILFHKSLGRSKTAMIYGRHSGGYCYIANDLQEERGNMVIISLLRPKWGGI